MALPSREQLYEDLYYWIDERESIRVRREIEMLPRPWTKDPIFLTTRFCNIRREDDTVTRWIKNNWRDPFALHPNLAFAMCLARVVNLPRTLEHLGFPHTWRPGEFIERMDKIPDKKWTSAYMVTGGYSRGGETKQQIIARVLDQAFIHAAKIRTGDTLEDAQTILSETKGLGTFLCAQVIADLKYTPLLEGAKDWWTFCAPGPGSTMGLNFLAGRPPTKAISPERFSTEVNMLREPIEDGTLYHLTAHDIQNCLCEFSKYVRIKYLGGRAKTSYNGGQDVLPLQV